LAQAPDTTKIEHSKNTAMLLAAIIVFLFMVFSPFYELRVPAIMVGAAHPTFLHVVPRTS
jgi:hypothetical protein